MKTSAWDLSRGRGGKAKPIAYFHIDREVDGWHEAKTVILQESGGKLFRYEKRSLKGIIEESITND